MSATSKKMAIAIRRKQVADAYLRGRTQAEIAVELGVNQATVSRDLQALREEWKRSALIDIDEAKARELAKIDAMEIEAWQAWERSQLDAEVELTKMQGTDPEKPGKLEKQRRIEGQVGDPRFLQIVQWCINKRCEILGINAPVRQEITGRDGAPQKVIFEVVRKEVPSRATNAAPQAGSIPGEPGQT